MAIEMLRERSVKISSKLYEKVKEKCKERNIHVKELIPRLVKAIVKRGEISPKKHSKIKRTTFDVDKNLWKEFRQKCIDLDLKAFKVIRTLIINWIKRHKT